MTRACHPVAVARRRSEILCAEMTVKNVESRIRALVNDPELTALSGIEFIPRQMPSTAYTGIGMKQSMLRAFVNAQVSYSLALTELKQAEGTLLRIQECGCGTAAGDSLRQMTLETTPNAPATAVEPTASLPSIRNSQAAVNRLPATSADRPAPAVLPADAESVVRWPPVGRAASRSPSPKSASADH